MNRNFPSLRLLSLLGIAVVCLGGCSANNLIQAEAARAPEYDGTEDQFIDGDDDPNTSSDDDDAGSSNDDDTEPPNEAPIVVAFDPEPETDSHHYRTPIVVTFDLPAEGASVSLYDASGYALPVTNRFNEQGTQLTAEPSQWLLPGAEYTVSVDVGEASLEYNFTTSDIGSPLQSGADVGGSTYAIDFSTAESGPTPALASLMGTLGEQAAWMWQVDFDSTDQAFGVTAGLGAYDDDGDGLYQDLCTATEVLATSDSPVELADPYFASEPGSMTITVDQVPLRFEAAWFDGDFIPDGSAMVEVGFYGWLQADSVEPISGPGEGCIWLNELLGLECVPCPSDDGQCAWVEVTGMEAGEVALGVDLVADEDADDCGGEAVSLLSCSASGRPGASLLVLLAGLLAVRIRRS
ncbi:MAG: Ig-like domain-containing protein [Proteobacteria bacterium]|nr:Ig-like domain-containing protein [Pseudomonadota bacterium]